MRNLKRRGRRRRPGAERRHRGKPRTFSDMDGYREWSVCRPWARLETEKGRVLFAWLK